MQRNSSLVGKLTQGLAASDAVLFEQGAAPLYTVAMLTRRSVLLFNDVQVWAAALARSISRSTGLQERLAM
ncbi:MAG: hypothetical protein JKY65_24300 [Planctomycetes bacterium]|nr:hypothetical protein [Planctomycetota bacterium]